VYAARYYRDPATGNPTKHMDLVKSVTRSMQELFAGLTVAEFRPVHSARSSDRRVRDDALKVNLRKECQPVGGWLI
jgi:hypothetical protein